MSPRYLIAALPLFLAACLPAHAERGHYGRGPVVERSPSIGELKRACDYGNRRACIGFGREIEQRREARRDAGWRDGRRWERHRDDRWRY